MVRTLAVILSLVCLNAQTNDDNGLPKTTEEAKTHSVELMENFDSKILEMGLNVVWSELVKYARR